MSASEGRSAERNVLAADVLRRRGRVFLRVRGESMLPTLWPGEIVEISACAPEDARSGEIVLAQRLGRIFLHRLLKKVESGRFVTRGDSMPRSDPFYISSQFLGRVEGVVRNGRIAPRPVGLRFRNRVLGLLFCYCNPARSLALRLHRWRTTRGSTLTITPESVGG